MSNPKMGSGANRFIGQGILNPAPIPYTASHYPGAALVANDGQFYYSDGALWRIPAETVPVARPQALSPTNSLQQTQLRLTSFFSPTGLSQTGVYFEVASSIDGFDTPLFTRTITSSDASLYQTLYPEDGLVPGQEFYWRALYTATEGQQSEFSLPFKQTYPELIDTPSTVTREGATTGSVELSDYNSIFGLDYVETQIQLWDIDQDPALDPPQFEVTAVTGSSVVLPDDLTEGQAYYWRGRYGGRIGSVGAITYSDWSNLGTILNGAKSMLLVFDPALASARTVYLPMGVYGGIVNVTVDWGDGTSDTYTSGGVRSHVYAPEVTGLVTVTISGQLEQYGGSANIQGLIRVDNIGYALGLTSLREMFRNVTTNTIYCNPALPPQVTDCYGMFYQSAGVGDWVSDLDMSSVQNFERMFYYSKYTGPLEWNTGSATSMKEMFYGYRDYTLFNHPSISNWDVSNVQNFEGMFKRNDVFNQPLNNWNTGSATNMSYMFGTDNTNTGVAFNQPIGAWDVSNVTNASRMFRYNANFNQNISNWTFPAGVNLEEMFLAASSFVGIGGVAGLGINGPSTIRSMFRSARNFTGAGLASWDVSNCSDFYYLFYDNDNINADLSGWNTQNLTTIEGLLSTTVGAVLNINWTSCPNLTNMSNAFYRTLDCVVEMENLDVSNVQNMSQLFRGSRGFNLDLGSWNTSNVNNMSAMFSGVNNASDCDFVGNIASWDVSNVLNMQALFGQNQSSWYDPDTPDSVDVSAWVLHPNVDLSTGIFSTWLGRDANPLQFGNEQYGKLLAGWANTIKNQADPPVQKQLDAGGEQYTGTVHFAASEFTTAAEGRAWLTTNFQLTVTSASNADANGDYLWNAATQSFVNGLGWYFIKDGANWKLFDAADALQSTGTEDVNYPWQVTTWSTVLSGAALDFSGAGWTITDGGLAP